MQHLLKVHNLSLKFAGKEQYALSSVSFDIMPGEVVGIAGESGSGKSLSSMTIMGLLPPSAIVAPESSILFQRKQGTCDLLKASPELRREIRGKETGMIFQEPMTSLNPVMRCGKQVAETLMKHQQLDKAEAEIKVIELFDRVKLPRAVELFHAWPHQLSGGQKQRVMIAMAIACKPSLLIADEPTTALDVTVQAAVISLLDELRKEMNMAILFISHDLGLMAGFADRVNILYRGSIIESGSAAQVFKYPEEAYTKGLLASLPRGNRPKKLPTVADFIPGPPAPEVMQTEEPELRKKRLEQIAVAPLLIDIKNISVTYSGNKNRLVRALDNVSFSIHRGESMGLVGESGSGKSTIGRAILGLTKLSGGEILLNGENISEQWNSRNKTLRRKMQMVFQDPYSALHPGMTTGEALMEPMKVHKLSNSASQRKEKAMYLLNKTGLSEEAFYKYPHEFSGGQRQRIVIARALALEPEFIVLDESVSALDVSVQAQILNLLKDLRDEFALTYLFISHDLSVIQYFCDRIAVLKSGTLIELQEADRLVQYPADDYTRTLIQAIPKRNNIFTLSN
jgi:peptide/nickel transport system ATP-binding protein